MAGWQNGYAEDCKSLYVGSIPAPASTYSPYILVMTMTKKELLALYEMMILIRRFEERSAQLYGQGLIQGFCHLYIGQEAVVTGLEYCRNKELDSVVTSYRDHGHMLAVGMDPKGVMAELLGRSGGYSKGKGGSMHMFSKEQKFYGGHGIVGASAPLGAGLAFAHQYRNDKGMCFCYFGDGAADQGQVFETFNMASLWKLPILFIIENNGYSMGTATHRHSAHPQNYHKRGEPFGIPGMPVNGMDILDVIEKGQHAVSHIKAGKGPYLLHVKTYRYRGHSMSDPALYRTKEEIAAYRDDNDPILNVKKILFDMFTINEGALEEIDDKIQKIVLESIEWAKSSPEPNAPELYTDVLL